MVYLVSVPIKHNIKVHEQDVCSVSITFLVLQIIFTVSKHANSLWEDDVANLLPLKMNISRTRQDIKKLKAS